MRNNYFAKIINYTKKAFNIDRSLSKLTDGRKNPRYTTGQAILSVLMGFLLRVRSFNTLNNMIKANEFKNILPKGIKLPQKDAIRDALKVINLEALRQMLNNNSCKARYREQYIS